MLNQLKNLICCASKMNQIVKLSNFLSLILIILILVQSSLPFEWQPLLCKTDHINKGLDLQYLIFHVDKLYFYYSKFVIRVDKVDIGLDNFNRKPNTENVIVIFGEAEYANYSDIEKPPDFMDQPTIVFYQTLWEHQWLTYLLRKDNKINRILYDEGRSAG